MTDSNSDSCSPNIKVKYCSRNRIGSDDEAEVGGGTSGNTHSDDDAGHSENVLGMVKLRRRIVCDDSEDDVEANGAETTADKYEHSKSEEGEVDNNSETEDNEKEVRKPMLKRIVSDDRDESLQAHEKIGQRTKPNVLKSTLISNSDLESEEEAEQDYSSNKGNEESSGNCKTSDDEEKLEQEAQMKLSIQPAKERKKRAKAMREEKQKIFSETQRMIREKEVALPYHRPKQRSLKEFLSRRKFQNRNAPLYSSTKSMAYVLEEIEKSTQNIFEFFKSESEDDMEEETNAKLIQGDPSQKDDSVKNPVDSSHALSSEVIESLDRKLTNHSMETHSADEEQEKLPEGDIPKNDVHIQTCSGTGELNYSKEDVNTSVDKLPMGKNQLETSEDWEPARNDQVEISKDKECARSDQVENSIQRQPASIEGVENPEEGTHPSRIDDLQVGDRPENQLIGNKSMESGNGKIKDNETFRKSDCKEVERSDVSTEIENLVVLSQCEESSKSVQVQNEKTELLQPSKVQSSWLAEVINYEMNEESPKVKFMKQKLNEKLLKITPKLSADEGCFIDLMDVKPPKPLMTGARQLMERFYKNTGNKQVGQHKEVEVTVATAEKTSDGCISSISTQKLKVDVSQSFVGLNDEDASKPGAKLTKLRLTLRKQMAEKWEEQYKLKLASAAADVKEGYEEALDGDDEEEVEEEESSNEEESEPEEDDIELVERKRKKSDFVDSEAEESGDDGGDEMDGDDAHEEEEGEKSEDEGSLREVESASLDGLECSLLPAYQPGGGHLNSNDNMGCSQAPTQASPGFSLTAISSLASPLFSKLRTPSPFLLASSMSDAGTPEPQTAAARKVLFPDCISATQYDIDEAFDLCSGKFPGENGTNVVDASQQKSPDFQNFTFNTDTQPNPRHATQRQRIKEIVGDEDVDEAEPIDEKTDSMQDVAGGEETAATLRIASSAEESDGDVETTAPRQRRLRKLKFSDDEGEGDEDKEEDEEDKDKEDEGDDSEDEEKEELKGKIEDVVYDSEENELEDDGNTSHRLKATDFFEKEAELSESEWSGDEDERGLDVLDKELGDEDVLDDDQVRNQLGKIHLRTVLNEDQREVRRLQELFFEDGDLHNDGKGRSKQFRWRNLDVFDNNDARCEDSGDDSEADDAEGEEQRRKSRHEKAIFLREMQEKGLKQSDDEDENSLLKAGHALLERMESKTSNLEGKKVVKVELDASLQRPFALFNKRGSFLTRNEEFLSRLAKATSGGDNVMGPKHSKNFVFTARSPDKETNDTNLSVKRKASTCSASSTKRLKTNSRPGDDSFDNSVPSLLDLLA